MTYEDNYLAHHGIKGQRWGIRRFQNEDGTLTAEGKQKYLINDQNNNGPVASVVSKQKIQNHSDLINSELRGKTVAKKNIEAFDKAKKKEEKATIFEKMTSALSDYYSKRENYIVNEDKKGSLRERADRFEKNNKNEHDEVMEYSSKLIEEASKTFDGYDEVPKSSSAKKLFNRTDDGWTPKYKDSKEYKDIEKKIESSYEESGYKAAKEQQMSTAGKEQSLFKMIKQDKALKEARNKYNKMTENYKKQKDEMKQKHRQEIIKCALQDMGLPVDERFYDIIKRMIFMF